MNILKFRRQFLMTTQVVTGLEQWKQLALGKHNLYTHPDLTTFYTTSEATEVVLLGHILDPKHHERTELEISKAIATSPNPKAIAKTLYGLSGRFVVIVKTGEQLLFFNDACGLRSFFYAQYDHNLQVASQPLLLQKVTGNLIGKTERCQHFMNSEYGQKKENYIPSGTSLYEGVHHLAPNHYLDSSTLQQHRYWPTEHHAINDYESSQEKFASLLQNIVVAGTKKYKLALGVTAGFDSRIILSTSKPVKDNMLFYTLKYRGMTHKSRDIKIPAKLNKNMHFNHQVYDCQIPIDQEFLKIYEQNSDMAHVDDWGFIAYGISQNLPKGSMAIKGSCSETGRCYFYKSGIHPVISSGAEMLEYNTGWKGIPFIEERMNDWFNELNDPKVNKGYPLLDLYHWEVSTGSWQTQNQLEWDIVHETFTPFNNRELLDIMLRIDPKYRSKPNNYLLYQDTINQLWPEVLSQPVNPPSTEEWIKTTIKTVLAKLGVEKYNH